MIPVGEPENQLVVRYAIFLAATELGTDIEYEKLTEQEKELVKKKCSEDPQLQDRVDLLKTSYIKLNEHLKGSEVGDLVFDPRGGREENKKSKFVKKRIWQEQAIFKYTTYAATAFLILIFSATAISELTTPPYLPAIREALLIKFTVARNASASENGIGTGRALFNQGKYAEAIEVFKREYRISKNAGDDTLKAFLAYHIGVSYLCEAEYSFFGLFPKYSLSKIDSSLKYLEISRMDSENMPLQFHESYLYFGINHFVRFAATGDSVDYKNAVGSLQKAAEHDHEMAGKANMLMESLEQF